MLSRPTAVPPDLAAQALDAGPDLADVIAHTAHEPGNGFPAADRPQPGGTGPAAVPVHDHVRGEQFGQAVDVAVANGQDEAFG